MYVHAIGMNDVDVVYVWIRSTLSVLACNMVGFFFCMNLTSTSCLFVHLFVTNFHMRAYIHIWVEVHVLLVRIGLLGLQTSCLFFGGFFFFRRGGGCHRNAKISIRKYNFLIHVLAQCVWFMFIIFDFVFW